MNFSHFLISLLSIVNEMSPYILLGFFIAGLLHAFVKPEMMARHLSGKGIRPVLKAALFGIPLPLCSCGVLPTSVSLRRQGASKGAATSFLIATPQTGVDSIAATYSLLGLPFAILRPIAALFGAVAGGWSVSRFDSEDSSESHGSQCYMPQNEASEPSFSAKLVEAIRYGFVDMVASVGKWLVVGLIIAALITVAVPDDLLLSLSQYPILAMLLMVVIAVPMYVCATGSIPIALSLICKGLTPGVGFVLLMAGPAANFASVMILNKTLGKRATFIYVVSVILTALLFGLIIDYILPRNWFMPDVQAFAPACHTSFGILETICSVILAVLLIYALYKNRNHNHSHNLNNTDTMTKEYFIEGMSCSHCRSTVEKALATLPGVKNVTVSLSDGKAIIEGDVADSMVIAAVSNAGFNVKQQ
ncbi:MAG: SO_0444 family Cu/Zn efflux transporter [Duncaniella sp.]|nr:SO_0444 family Cu/Zn efflux transporter [Duncaniella sp.]MDE7145625.1 SO_0444 family Cu/Zn efflux transporter [Duncaniella sp.]